VHIPKEINKILIVLIAGIGDLILASKAIRSVRNGYPSAEIHLLTNADASLIAQYLGYLDKIWTFEVRKLRNNMLHIFKMLRTTLEIRKKNYDMSINLYQVSSRMGAHKMALLFKMIGSKVNIGQEYKGLKFCLTDKLPESQFKEKHFVEAMNDIALSAGGLPDEKGIEARWNPECEKKWERFFGQLISGSSDQIIGINPGGDRGNRRWCPNNYALVADGLIKRLNAKIVILGGPGEEEIAATIQNKMGNESVSLAGRIALDELPYVISLLDILITNDSGPMHIGAAVKTPLVAVYGPENHELVGPFTAPDLIKIVSKDTNCKPCNKDHCEETICLDLISPQEVIEKSLELMRLNHHIAENYFE
jgi:lipopolysaccharide heptosyltransferase II